LLLLRKRCASSAPLFGLPHAGAARLHELLYGGAFGLLKNCLDCNRRVFLYDISVEDWPVRDHEAVRGRDHPGPTPATSSSRVLLRRIHSKARPASERRWRLPAHSMIGLGFRPFQAAALNLIANTAPVAWGSIGTPVPHARCGNRAARGRSERHDRRILPITAVIVPFWLWRTMVSWSETIEVLPAKFFRGGRRLFFRGHAMVWSNHMDSNLVDIAAGMTAMIATLLFLRVWQPKRIWRFEEERAEDAAKLARKEQAVRHTGPQIAKAWMPFAILSLFVLLWGLPTIKTAMGKATTPAFSKGGWKCRTCTKPFRARNPWSAKPTPENAKFDFNWLTAVGTGCFLAAMLSGFFLGLGPGKNITHFWAHAVPLAISRLSL